MNSVGYGYNENCIEWLKDSSDIEHNSKKVDYQNGKVCINKS